jgi:two-component system phosphate regulon sensor histidine kinase PhoR
MTFLLAFAQAQTASGNTSPVIVGIAIVAVLAAAFAIARALTFARATRSLRAAVLARARGEATPLPSYSLRDLMDLANAVERLSARAAAREADLRQETADVRVVLHTVTDGIVQLDAAGRIVRTNPAADTLLGLSPAATGQPFAALVRNVELRNLLQQAAHADTSAEIAIHERRLFVSARRLEGDGGGPAGLVIALADLTELRRLEGVRRDFVANVSHELKTPLTSIRGYAETLLNDADLPADMRRQFLEVVYKNADRLHHIVDDLLDLSRLESGGWQPRMQEFDVQTVLMDVVSACSARASARNITLVAADTPVNVRADPAGLRQILSNLLENALRYTPAGGRVVISVKGAAKTNGNGAHRRDVVFEVRDTGVGIPSDDLPRIFERFYRVDPARSRAEGGTGLGLSIVKHLVESMDGDVHAASELGKGTTITFRLPAAG